VVEIPNALTGLLNGKTPREIYDALRKQKCLSPAGIEGRVQVIAVATEAEAEARRDAEAGMVGGSREFRIILALSGRGFLNPRARKLLDRITYKAKPKLWWRFWA
jgi:hypothetical protein